MFHPFQCFGLTLSLWNYRFRLGSLKKRIPCNWLIEAIFESSSCEMFTYRQPGDLLGKTSSGLNPRDISVTVQTCLFAFLFGENKFEHTTFSFRGQLTIDQVKRLESNVFVQLVTRSHWKKYAKTETWMANSDITDSISPLLCFPPGLTSFT